jgi:glucoamylase
MPDAPGWPGIPARWTSSAKDGIATALSPLSRVWVTLSHGILNEVYYPRVDQACTRDFGLLVSDGRPGGFFSEEKRDTVSELSRAEDGVPLFRLRNTCREGRYRIEKWIVCDPRHDVVLQRIALEPLGNHDNLRLFALLAPHLVNGGAHNTGWLGSYKGEPMLFAEGDGTCLAVASSRPWLARSVGFVGVSDGWQDVSQNGAITWGHDRAADGNVALTAELDIVPGEPLLLALGFGRYYAEAAFRARASLARGFELIAAEYTTNWRNWQRPLAQLDPPREHRRGGHNFYRISTAVLRTHDSYSFPGGIIASLSIPWGASKGDDDLGGYHLVWPRDLVETAGGLVACGAYADARRVLDYLRTIQEADGHWPQNNWLDGLAYWRGIQMDECAFPILLAELAHRYGALSDADLPAYWPMLRAAAGFVLRNGPCTAQDRWEEDAGYSPFTLAVEVAGLLAAAELAERVGEDRLAVFLRDTADAWNDDIETWTYVTDTPLAREAGVRGYYVRLAPDGGETAGGTVHGVVQVRNRLPQETEIPADGLVSPDALALVRFGLRAPDDPRIRDTITVIDRLLRVELPEGPAWRRYNCDGYGEHPDGRPFDGTGQGRTWPLLIGERAHYALAAGDDVEARRLLATMEACASAGGMLPEQVWDADDIAELELFRGRPSGSAMPLVWAHSEHIKLLRSLAAGAVFDTPPQPVQRYLKEGRRARLRDWRPTWRRTSLPAGQALRVELAEPASVLWTGDDWQTSAAVATEDTGLGIHAAELPAQSLSAGRRIVFTWQRQSDGGWLGRNYEVAVI